MGRIDKIKRELIEESNKKLLNEQEESNTITNKEVWIITNRESHGAEAINGVYKTLENAMKDKVFENYEETPEVLTAYNGKLYAMSESFYILSHQLK